MVNIVFTLLMGRLRRVLLLLNKLMIRSAYLAMWGCYWVKGVAHREGYWRSFFLLMILRYWWCCLVNMRKVEISFPFLLWCMIRREIPLPFPWIHFCSNSLSLSLSLSQTLSSTLVFIYISLWLWAFKNTLIDNKSDLRFLKIEDIYQRIEDEWKYETPRSKEGILFACHLFK